MKNKIKEFMHEKFGTVRTINIDDIVYFVGIDIACALKYSNASKAISTHCKHSLKVSIDVSSHNGKSDNKSRKTQDMYVINKGDIYRLIVRSKLPVAEEFETWVFDEVLPQIELTGGYIPIVKEDTPELIMARGLKVADETIKKKDEIIAQKDKRIAELEPEAELAKMIIDSKGWLTLKQVADLIETGRTTLCSILRQKKILSKQTGYNEPMGKYIRSGYFRTIVEEDEKEHISVVTLVSPRGLRFIYRLIKRNELLDEFDTIKLQEVKANA